MAAWCVALVPKRRLDYDSDDVGLKTRGRSLVLGYGQGLFSRFKIKIY